MIDKVVARVASFLLSVMPQARFQKEMVRLIQSRIKKLPPAEGLRFLFGLDAEMYALSGQLARQYNGGLHTKHRHTGYHFFFTDRISSHESVIDIGCGLGAVAFDVAQLCGATVHGVDLDAKNIAEAKRLFAHPRLTFAVEDARELQSGRNYDVAILSNVLEHIDDRPGFLAQLIRATQAKRFLIRVPTFERDWRVPLKKELGVEWRLDPDHRTEYTLTSFREDAVAAGLEIRHLETRWGEIWSELEPDG